jgi:menaquinone-dependent protoporphyrinogen IX oxidase
MALTAADAYEVNLPSEHVLVLDKADAELADPAYSLHNDITSEPTETFPPEQEYNASDQDVNVTLHDDGTITAIIDGEAITYKRFREDVYTNVHPSQLDTREIAYISAKLDADEGKRNKKFKNLLSKVFSNVLDDSEIIDVGAGQYPIQTYMDKMDSNATFIHRAIEIDKKHVDVLKAQGVDASEWPEALERGGSKDVPTIATSIFALHFMANAELPPRISELTRDGGLFIGNYYATGTPVEKEAEREKLRTVLAEYNETQADEDKLHYTMITASKNEIWVIHRANESDAELAQRVIGGLDDEFENRGTATTKVSSASDIKLYDTPGVEMTSPSPIPRGLGPSPQKNTPTT